MFVCNHFYILIDHLPGICNLSIQNLIFYFFGFRIIFSYFCISIFMKARHSLFYIHLALYLVCVWCSVFTWKHVEHVFQVPENITLLPLHMMNYCNLGISIIGETIIGMYLVSLFKYLKFIRFICIKIYYLLIFLFVIKYLSNGKC